LLLIVALPFLITINKINKNFNNYCKENNKSNLPFIKIFFVSTMVETAAENLIKLIDKNNYLI